MICKNCAEAADTNNMMLHNLCRGPSWCDCAHKEIKNGCKKEDPRTVRDQD